MNYLETQNSDRGKRRRLVAGSLVLAAILAVAVVGLAVFRSEEPLTKTAGLGPDGVGITVAVSATQVLEGETINFTAVTQQGSPNNWESEVSPSGPELQPLEAFGSFRYLFPDAGTYIITLAACDPDENCDDARVEVEVMEDPDTTSYDACTEPPQLPNMSGPLYLETGQTGSFAVDDDPCTTELSWSAQGDSWIWNPSGQTTSISWSAPGIYTITVVLSGPGGILELSSDVTVSEPVAQPDPASMSVSCTVGTTTTADRFTCSLSSGNQGAFSSPSWSIAPGGTLSWGGAGSFSIDVQGTAPGTVTVTLSATDIATGTLVQASAEVTITGGPVPVLGLRCSASTRPADGTSDTTCTISNRGEFTDISFSVSNPSGLTLNHWGGLDDINIASSDAGQVTVTATATHTASGTVVSSTFSVTFEAELTDGA